MKGNRANCEIILWRLVYSLSGVIYVFFFAMLGTLTLTATGSQIKVLLLTKMGEKSIFLSLSNIISYKHMQYVLLFLNRYISNYCSPLPVLVCILDNSLSNLSYRKLLFNAFLMSLNKQPQNSGIVTQAPFHTFTSKPKLNTMLSGSSDGTLNLLKCCAPFIRPHIGYVCWHLSPIRCDFQITARGQYSCVNWTDERLRQSFPKASETLLISPQQVD